MLGRTIRLYQNSYAGLSKDVWVLTIILFVNRSGAMVIPFLTILMTSSKGFSLQEAGYMMSAFGLGSVVGTNVGGRLTDKFNPYPIMFWSLILSGFSFLSLLLVDGLWGYCFVLFLLSSVSDAYRPANSASLAFYSKPENYTRSFGLLRLAANLGFAVGPGLGGLIIASFSYDALFIADGITCFLASFALLYALDPKKIKAKKAEKKEAEEVLGKAQNISPIKDKLFLAFIGLNFLTAMGFMQFFSTVPVYFKDILDFSEKQIGLIMAMNGLLIALIEMPLVFTIENKYKALNLISIGAILYGLSYSVFHLTGIAQLAPWIFIFLLSIGEILNMPFSNSWVSQRSSIGTQGRYMGIFGMSWATAFIIGPSFSTYIAETYSFDTLWHVTALFCFVPGFGFLWLRKSLESEKKNTSSTFAKKKEEIEKVEEMVN